MNLGVVTGQTVRSVLLTLLLAMDIARGAEPIPMLEVFDAQPLLRIDLGDPAGRRRSWDRQHLLAALQGLVNRDRPRLYILAVGHDAKDDRYWLEKLRRPGEWLADAKLREQNDLLALVREHRSHIQGVVLWDERVPATALVASTAAGVEDLLPLRWDPAPDSLYHQLVEAADGPKLPVKLRLLNEDCTPLFTGEKSGSAKCDALLWGADRYLKTGRCNATRLGYYPDAWWLQGKARVPALHTLLVNHDYFIAQRGFFFDLSPWDDEAPNDDSAQKPGTDARTLRQILAAAHGAAGGSMIHVGGFTPWDQKYTDYTGGRHEGVPTEWRYAEILSCFDAFMDADAPGLHAMANASVFQHFPLADRYPQPAAPTTAELRTRGYLTDTGKVAARNFFCIYAGDYDSAAWLYQRLPEVWDDPARGSVPLGWAFNPALAERFPVGLAYARSSATPNDLFIAGDSGFGYLNPGDLVPPRRWSDLPSGLASWQKLCEAGYQRWDLRVTGFVIDGDAPGMNSAVRAAYARFSPEGVVAQKIPERSLVNGVPFLRMGSDLADPKQGARIIAGAFPADPKEAGFSTFRTILWTPSAHRQMVGILKKERPDIQIVDPHTLFELLRRRLQEK